jgi:hypothetical protein
VTVKESEISCGLVSPAQTALKKICTLAQIWLESRHDPSGPCPKLVTRLLDLEPSDNGQWLIRLAHCSAHLYKAQKQENQMNLNHNSYVQNLKQPFSQLTPLKYR